MAIRFFKILSNGNKIFLKISSNGNKIFKSKLMTASSYMIIFNFSFPFPIDKWHSSDSNKSDETDGDTLGKMSRAIVRFLREVYESYK